jgi:hypothetical protein
MAERRDELLVWLYVTEIVFFVAHSADSSRFAEWELFRMTPTIYILSYLPFMALMLYALVELVRARRAGYILAGLYGLVGLTALAVHGPQLLRPVPEFHTVVSVILIAGLVLTGTAVTVLSGLALKRMAE